MCFPKCAKTRLIIYCSSLQGVNGTKNTNLYWSIINLWLYFDIIAGLYKYTLKILLFFLENIWDWTNRNVQRGSYRPYCHIEITLELIRAPSYPWVTNYHNHNRVTWELKGWTKIKCLQNGNGPNVARYSLNSTRLCRSSQQFYPLKNKNNIFIS